MWYSEGIPITSVKNGYQYNFIRWNDIKVILLVHMKDLNNKIKDLNQFVWQETNVILALYSIVQGINCVTKLWKPFLASNTHSRENALSSHFVTLTSAVFSDQYYMYTWAWWENIDYCNGKTIRVSKIVLLNSFLSF